MARSDFLAIFGTPLSDPHQTRELKKQQHTLRDVWRHKITYDTCHEILKQTILIINRTNASDKSSGAFISQVDSLASYVPRDKLRIALTLWLKRVGLFLLRLPGPAFHPPAGEPDVKGYLDQLYRCGLLDARSQLAIADAAQGILDRLIEELCQQKSWQHSVKDDLMARVNGDFSRLLTLFLSPIASADGKPTEAIEWCSLAQRKLGERRAKDFFLMTEQRDLSLEDCAGALEDLKLSLQNPQHRVYLYEDFTTRLKRDLLQPGRSTVDILDIFVRTVHRLKYIDPYGSLLNEVAKTFRSYIRLREDAVRIMLINFLEGCRATTATPSQPPLQNPDFSHNIASSVRMETSYKGDFFEGQDLRDLSWQPEPVDATIGHQETRSLDDLGHLIKLAPPKTFITDLQTLYRSRLLSAATSDYTQEMDLLQLLKRRFDTDSSFQNVEVMLNDVLTSHSSSSAIRARHSMSAAAATDADLQSFTFRILSKAYWTHLPESFFNLPETMMKSAQEFSHTYAVRNEGRRLEWNGSLGTAHVDLSFDDGRTFEGDVSTAQATVIHAFEASSSLSVEHLMEETKMEETLLRPALSFWVSQGVLASSSSSSTSSTSKTNQQETYTIIEHAPTTSGSSTTKTTTTTNQIPSPQPDPQDAALKSPADLLRDNGLMYGNFITALLTNQGGMPAPRIHMILGAMMPGGFPFEMADLVGFLRDMALEGRIENSGGVWKIKH